MNDDQVLEQLSHTDVYASGTEMPVAAWSRSTALREIERRVGMELRTSTDEAGAGAALLDTDERRGTMQTQETKRPIATPPKARKRLVAAAAVFALVVIAAGAALWIASQSEDPVPADPAAPVTEAPETDATPPDGAGTMSFDEASMSCTYDGPATFQENQQVVFTAVNNSALPVEFGVVALASPEKEILWTPGAGDPEIVVIGTDNFVGLSESAAEATFDRMRLGMVEGTVPDHVGTWLLYCNSAEESPRFFYDRTATFQVLSAG